MDSTPVFQPDTTNNPTVQAPFKPRRKIPFIPILGVSITAVVAIGIVVGLMWQSNVFIAKNQDVRSEASGASVKALDTINLGISDATTPLDPLFSYYDDLSNRTYVVWSGGAKTDYPAGSCHDIDGDGPSTDMVCFPRPYSTSAMHVFIKYYDHATKTWSASKKVFEPKHKELYGDGHYAQGVVVDNNGYIHVFQSYHISLRPKGSTEEVGIRHATSLRAGSIDSWTTAQDVEDSSGLINTDRNTHGRYFKSRAGNIYGLYRKSITDSENNNIETQTMFKFKPATTPSNGNNGIEPGSLTVKDVIVPDKKTTTQQVLSWDKINEKVIPQTMTMGWHDAITTGYKYDAERDGFHLVFTLRGGRTYTQKYYYVFYSFQNDRFYGPNGIDMGSDIVPTKFGTLNTCCVIHDYGTPRDHNALAGEPVIMLDEDQYPTFYLNSVDVQANETSKTIQEINFNPVDNKWEAKKLTSLGFTHRVQDAVYVNPDNKYLITLSVAGDPGMGGSHVYHWNGLSWSKKQDIIETLFYPKKQTRSFRFAENFRRDLSGFFINVDDSAFALPAWTIWGYYEGPIKSKLFGFRLNELLQSPVYNGNFEKNSFLGWPSRDDLDPINTSIVDCAKWGVSCPQGKYHLKLVAKNDNKGDYVPYLASDNMDMRENLTEKSIKITFKAKVHTGSAQYSGVWLQRARNLASANPWQDTASAIQPITLTTQWQTFSQIVQLPKSGNNSTTTKVRIVLNPIDKPFDNPVYFDDFQLEYLGEIAPPTSTPTPPNCSGVEISSISPSCSATGAMAVTLQWPHQTGASDYAIAIDDDPNFWADSSAGNEQGAAPYAVNTAGGSNATRTWSGTFPSGSTRHFRIRTRQSTACTPQDWLYGAAKNATITCTTSLPSNTPIPRPSATPTSSPDVVKAKRIVVRAKGVQGDGAWPQLELRIKNAQGVYQPAHRFTVNSAKYRNYAYTHTTAFDASQVRLAFVNDKGPRDVYVDYIRLGKIFQTESPSTYSTGTWNNATKRCDGRYAASEALHCNGYFDFFK